MTRSKNENTAKATNTHKYASTWLAVVFTLLFCFFSSLLFGAHSLSPQRSHFASLCLSSLDSFLCGWLFFADKIPRAIAYWDLPASYSTIAWLQFVHTKSIKSFDICICAFFSCRLFGCCFFCLCLLHTIYEFTEFIREKMRFFPVWFVFARSGPHKKCICFFCSCLKNVRNEKIEFELAKAGWKKRSHTNCYKIEILFTFRWQLARCNEQRFRQTIMHTFALCLCVFVYLFLFPSMPTSNHSSQINVHSEKYDE